MGSVPRINRLLTTVFVQTITYALRNVYIIYIEE